MIAMLPQQPQTERIRIATTMLDLDVGTMRLLGYHPIVNAAGAAMTLS